MGVLQPLRGREGKRFLTIDAPWRVRAIDARMIEAKRIARRIAQPGFAPKPSLHRRILFKHDARRFEAADFGVEIVAFEIDLRRVLTGDLALRDMQRERRSALWNFETRIMGAFDDELEAELAIEPKRRFKVCRRRGDLIETHASYFSGASDFGQSLAMSPRHIHARNWFMSFRVSGLDPELFADLHALCDAALAAKGVERVRVERKPDAPCRISLDDAEVGETVLLLNYDHQPAQSPYRQQGPIFVRETKARFIGRDVIPPALQARVLSLRGFSDAHMMIEADLVEGAQASQLVERFFANPRVAYIHAHYAKRGCYAARFDRA